MTLTATETKQKNGWVPGRGKWGGLMIARSGEPVNWEGPARPHRPDAGLPGGSITCEANRFSET